MPLYFKQKEFRKKESKITHILIKQDEKIERLKYIQFKICDNIYDYSVENIRDTISEIIKISDRIFPCKVSMIYIYENDKKKEFDIEDFNCAGCSGSNIYTLTEDRIKYQYNP